MVKKESRIHLWILFVWYYESSPYIFHHISFPWKSWITETENGSMEPQYDLRLGGDWICRVYCGTDAYISNLS